MWPERSSPSPWQPCLSHRDRHSVVTVELEGVPHVIADIGMRMLTPRELLHAQGFPADYIIKIPLTRTAQIRMCGNSVVPTLARALVEANFAPAPIRVSRRREREAPLFAGLEIAA